MATFSGKIDDFKKKIREKNITLKQISKTFFRVSAGSNDSLNSKIDLMKFLMELDVAISEDDYENIIKDFKFVDGKISHDMILERFMPPLTEERREDIERLFKSLNPDKDGYIYIDDLIGRYAEGDKEHVVINGRRMNKDHFRDELINSFDINRNGKIDIMDFILFYSEANDLIKDDNDWKKVLNQWHI